MNLLLLIPLHSLLFCGVTTGGYDGGALHERRQPPPRAAGEPSGETLDAAARLVLIEQASALADALVGPRYPPGAGGQAFPDVTDTPATPPLVELATRKLAASMAWDAIHVAGTEPDRGAALYREALDWFVRIRTGELAIVGADGTDYAGAVPIASSTARTEPTFRRGRYDGEGNLLDDVAGSLDEF